MECLNCYFVFANKGGGGGGSEMWNDWNLWSITDETQSGFINHKIKLYKHCTFHIDI